MLAEVVDHGTGTDAAIDGYEAAGKTGTARKPQEGGGYRDATAGNYHYVATFAGFLPAADPKLSVIVVIDEPTTSPYAGTVAAPAFAEIGRRGPRHMGVAPGLAPPAPAARHRDPGGRRVRPRPAPDHRPRAVHRGRQPPPGADHRCLRRRRRPVTAPTRGARGIGRVRLADLVAAAEGCASGPPGPDRDPD